jgi:hypothetical protein
MQSQTYETPGPLRLHLAIPSGAIEIETAPGTETTRVELEPLTDSARQMMQNARVELREGANGHEVIVDVAATRAGYFISFGRGPDFSLRITCPPGAALDIETKSADVHARGVYGEAVVKTASGDVEIGEVEGDVRIKTASGDVSLDDVHGSTGVQTASGDLAAQRTRGDVTGHLVSGDVWIRDALRSVAVNTVSGDVRLDAVAEGAIDVTAISGDILVGVRRGARVYMDCNTISGSTSSELELSDTPARAEPGAEGAPQLDLRAKTVSGDIVVTRAAAPSSLPAA